MRFSTTHCNRPTLVCWTGVSGWLRGKQRVMLFQRFSLASPKSALKRRFSWASFRRRSSCSRKSRASGFKSTDSRRVARKLAVFARTEPRRSSLFLRTQSSISSRKATTGLRRLSVRRCTGSPSRSHLRALLGVRCKHSAISFHPFRIFIASPTCCSKAGPEACPFLSVYP